MTLDLPLPLGPTTAEKHYTANAEQLSVHIEFCQYEQGDYGIQVGRRYAPLAAQSAQVCGNCVHLVKGANMLCASI